ncbi:hypothetical protein [Pantoea stewartii]|uniref:hypothetical protein n=1 Tax=Pantoea stewartii TaxID=66269 RepID=UPI00162AF63A|nr:hypothetical protein [Pantoea stewartii]MBC0854355.1 hypothetical protein [Pantoea stewartii]UYK99076.1 hypothetical protein NG832_08825 [Pantoea stewartii]
MRRFQEITSCGRAVVAVAARLQAAVVQRCLPVVGPVPDPVVAAVAAAGDDRVAVGVAHSRGPVAAVRTRSMLRQRQQQRKKSDDDSCYFPCEINSKLIVVSCY